MSSTDYEVVIIGAGPAGLSAGLVLGRCLRKVLICDNQDYRNQFSSHINGYLTRDGISPKQFREIAHQELKKYTNIEFIYCNVTDIKKQNGIFNIIFDNKDPVSAHKVLLAIGRRDNWPSLEGAQELYGKSIFHCPYCDGWEWKQKALAVFSQGDKGADYALLLKQWSQDVCYFTNGPSQLSQEKQDLLKKHHIPIYEQPILRLESHNGKLTKIVLKDSIVDREVIFFNTDSYEHFELIKKIQCELDQDNKIIHEKLELTKQKGIFVAGDVCHDVYQAISSAGQGTQAAIYINDSLVKDSL